MTEGGYDVRALADSLRAVIASLGAETSADPQWPESTIEPTRGRASVNVAKTLLGKFWKF